MSELKAFTLGLGRYTENGSPCVVAFDDEDNPRLASDEKFYIKSEADKVIAKLKNEIEVQKRIRDMVLGYIPNVLKVMKIIQHHKYKQCLAMAKICENKLGTVVKPKWWYKWYKCWLKLAEKYKETKR